METVRLTENNSEEAITRAVAVLRSGGVVLYPTDTLYGLGADAFSDDAVAKVYAIKGRDEKKPIHCVVPNLEAAAAFAEVTEAARRLAERLLPGPLTLVLAKKPGFDSGIGKGMATVGVRVPANDFCIELAKQFGPYTTTSANLAGAANERSAAAILGQLGERASMVDLVVDAGELPQRQPSTVVDVSSDDLKVLREGAISEAEIRGG